MRLKYLKGKEIVIREAKHVGATHRPYKFNPYGDVPDSIASRIMRNPRYAGMFEERPRGLHVCEKCGKDYPNDGSLKLHRYNQHTKKELKNENSNLNNNDTDALDSSDSSTLSGEDR